MPWGRKRLKVAAPSALPTPPPTLQWNLCFICQKGGGKIICPVRNPIPEMRYRALETMAGELTAMLGKGTNLPNGLPLDALNEGGVGFLETLKARKAVYHKKCYVMLRRERVQSDTQTCDEGENITDPVAALELPSPSEQSSSRSETRSSTPKVDFKEKICLFCQTGATTKKPLRQCAMDSVYENITKCARVLKDTKLLATFATEGDVFAIEGKYHILCLSRYYNQARKVTAKEENAEDTVICEGLAFADLFLYIQGKLSAIGKECVFRLPDLKKMYTSRLAQLLGVPETNVAAEQTSRFREKVLSAFPQLQAHKSGREYVFLSENVNILPNLDSEDQDEDAIALHRFIKGIRNSILSSQIKFDGNLDPANEEACIPRPLLAVVNLLLFGDAYVERSNASRSAVTISQLILFNAKTKAPTGSGALMRHNKKREPPLAMALSLRSYGRNRDKLSIQNMHRLGLGVSYTRIMEVTAQLCRMVVRRAEIEGVMCPSILENDLFTICVVDNIDIKATSTTASEEFHGTGVSVFQLPVKGAERHPRPSVVGFKDVEDGGSTVPDLPDNYGLVPEYVPQTKAPLAPLCTSAVASFLTEKGTSSLPWGRESDWLEAVHTDFETSSKLSWAVYHSGQEEVCLFENAIGALLPLFHEKSASFSMIKHAMDVTQNVISFLNKEQTPVLCGDQPLYALMKAIQWNLPNVYGEKKFVALLGPFHIEQSFLKVIGKFLQGSGWVGVVSNAGLATDGSAEAMLKVTHVTRARNVYAVTAAALHSLLQDAYAYDHPDEDVTINDWIKEKSAISPVFHYWILVLQLIVLILAFVRSVRQGNFGLFKECIREMLPWYFSMGHPNYARWLSVHLKDLYELETTAPDVHQQFCMGNFVVRKTGRKMSAMGLDQAHEQNNEAVKGRGGAVGRTHDRAQLRRYTIGGPEVQRLLDECRETPLVYAQEDHHDQGRSFQMAFRDKFSALKEGFLECGNPFAADSPELYTVDSRVCICQDGVDALRSVEATGKSMYDSFVSERLQTDSKSVYAKIKQPNLRIFVGSKQVTSAHSVKTIRADAQLFSRLFIACCSRKLNLDVFFQFENQLCPPSLSLAGDLRSGTKSHLVDILESNVIGAAIPTVCEGLIIDGAAMLHLLKPRPGVMTFASYVQDQIKPFLLRAAEKTQTTRIDIVWDIYSDTSIKDAVRKKRGSGVRRLNLPLKGALPTNWADYLKNDGNKSEAFCYIASELLGCLNGYVVVTNVGKEIKAFRGNSSLNGVDCSAMEEADGRLILHAKDMADNGMKSVILRASDTDIVVLAISFFHTLRASGLSECWILCGTGKHLRYVPIHTIATHLGEQKSSALRGFHAFTGCDTTSFFACKGKKTAFKAWDDRFNGVFNSLASPSLTAVTDEMLDELEQFTVNLYGVCNQSCKGVNEARKLLFATQNKPVHLIPPTRDALEKHAQRSAYQAGQLWGRADGVIREAPCPSLWGWKMEGRNWKPSWTTKTEIWADCRALDRCGCTTGCDTMRCLCRRGNLPCTLSCRKCKGMCGNRSLPTIPEEPEEDDEM